MTKSYKLNSVIIFILGIITSFSLPPYNIFILNFLTFSLFLIFLIELKKQNQNSLKFFFYGWCFGFGYFLSSLYWISISLTFDNNFKFLLPLSLILIPAFLAIFYGLATFLLKFIINDKKIIISILLFSLLLALVEFLRGNILSGFPWNLIGYSFSNQLEFIQINSVLGIYGFNLFSITIFAVPSIFILRNSKKEIFSLLFIIIVCIGILFYGFNSIDKFKAREKIISKFKIVLISSSISLDRFYSDLKSDMDIIQELIILSNPKKYIDQKTIFVWPEGILPNTNVKNLSNFKELFKENFGNQHFLILGLNREENLNNQLKFYNSLALINNSGNVLDIYDKKRLVPFGEFLPLENLLSKLGLKSLTNNYQSYSPGSSKEKILRINNDELGFLPLICYEIIYSGQIIKNQSFDHIINISEDGWFGKSIGPHQHFVHSIFRSIETGKYILRSANNGITSITDPKGKIVSRIKLEDKGSIIFDEYKKTNETLYSRFGNKTFLVLIFIYIFLIFSFNRIKYE